jgi:hypothetical protein
MIFDVVGATIGLSKYGDADGRRSVSFEVVPKDRNYLKIGDKYVACSEGYHRLLHKDRERVPVTVHVTTDRHHIERAEKMTDEAVCGSVSFYPERVRDTDYDPPSLEFVVTVEPSLFDELFKLRLRSSEGATMSVSIADLTFGWEPDGSGQIWKHEEEPKDGFSYRKPVTDFWINVHTFSTSQREISEAEDRKHRLELAASADPEERKLAADLAPVVPEDAATKLLAQCRMILLAILVVAVVMLFRR